MDDAILLQIASYARMDPEASITAAGGVGFNASLLLQTRQQINEHQVLAKLFETPIDVVSNESLKAFLQSSAEAHKDQAGILQRRRPRKRNPLNQAGRALGWVFRQSGRALRDLTPRTLKELIKDYALHGTPISVKTF